MSERTTRRFGLLVATAIALGVISPVLLPNAQAQPTTTTTSTTTGRTAPPVDPNSLPPFFADYPAVPRPDGARLHAPSTAAAGSTITISGDGCRWDGWDGTPVEAAIAFGRPPARLTYRGTVTDAAGDWHVSMTLPPDLQPGVDQLHAACFSPSGDGGFRYESTTITVTRKTTRPAPVTARPRFTG